MITEYLTLSDSAKYAQAAKNLADGFGMQITHSFYNSSLLDSFVSGDRWKAGFLPLPSWILALFFKFFPANDATVIGVGLLMFLLLIVVTYVLTRKIFGQTSAVISIFLLLCQSYLWEYAFNSSSEIFFALEVVVLSFCIFMGKKGIVPGLITLVLMFLTRQQAIVFFVTILLFFWIKQMMRSVRTGLIYSAGAALLLFVVIFISRYDVSSTFSPLKPLYSGQMSSLVNPGAYLRGVGFEKMNLNDFGVKIFYNTYNFLKDPQRVAEPFTLIAWSFFLISKKKDEKHFDLSLLSFLSLAMFIFAASASLPNARYIHPILPVICIGAGVWLSGFFTGLKKNWMRLSFVGLLLWVSLPVLGSLTLDRRFLSRTQNTDKPQTVKVISQVIHDNTKEGEIVLTNLDAWAAWYFDVRTMWFPVSIETITNKESYPAYIAISNYNAQDADFALNDWGQLLDVGGFEKTPLKEHYHVVYKGTISAKDVRENQDIGIIILEENAK